MKIIKFFLKPFTKPLSNRFSALHKENEVLKNQIRELHYWNGDRMNEIQELRSWNGDRMNEIQELRSWNSDRMNEIRNLQKTDDELRQWNGDRMKEIQELRSWNMDRMSEIRMISSRCEQANAQIQHQQIQLEEHYQAHNLKCHTSKLITLSEQIRTSHIDFCKNLFAETIKKNGTNLSALDLGFENTGWRSALENEGVFYSSLKEDVLSNLKNFQDDSVDIVTAFFVAESFDLNVFIKITKEIFRILRNGGFAFFETLDSKKYLCLEEISILYSDADGNAIFWKKEE